MLTAAHKTLPFGLVLRVTRESNGRSVIVRVNDRGPFIKGRHVDLSLEAARKLNMLHSGITTVLFEIISDRKGDPLRRGEAFYLVLQTAASARAAGARVADACNDLPDALRGDLPRPQVFARERDARLPRFFVGLGPFVNFTEASRILFRFPLDRRPELICATAGPVEPAGSGGSGGSVEKVGNGP
jgi:hypothetical protein